MRKTIRSALWAICVAIAATSASLVVTATPAQAKSSVNGPISRAEVLQRAQYWVDSGYVYSPQAPVSYTFSPDMDGKQYRNDCSGLVSMAWHLGTSYVTGDFQDTSPSRPWMALSSLHDLRPGDAVVQTGHMELFAFWKNENNHGQGAYVYAFNSPHQTVQNPFAPNNYGNLGFRSWSQLTSYMPIRYEAIVSNPQVFEASSANAWQNLPVSGPGGTVSGSAVAAISVGGVKYVYTIKDGQVYEASSANAWQNLPVIGVSGPVRGTALAALAVGSTRYIYTINGNQVYEASSANVWQNLPVSGVSGNVTGRSVAALAVGTTKYVYTITDSGQVYEASSANAWQNLPVSGISGNVTGHALAVLAVGTTKYVYTITSAGQVYEASSANAWQNLPVIGVSGTVRATAVAAIAIGTTKYLYTTNGGWVHEASSANAWKNLPVSGVTGAAVAAIAVSGTKLLYTL